MSRKSCSIIIYGSINSSRYICRVRIVHSFCVVHFEMLTAFNYFLTNKSYMPYSLLRWRWILFRVIRTQTPFEIVDNIAQQWRRSGPSSHQHRSTYHLPDGLRPQQPLSLNTKPTDCHAAPVESSIATYSYAANIQANFVASYVCFLKYAYSQQVKGKQEESREEEEKVAIRLSPNEMPMKRADIELILISYYDVMS